MYTKMTASRRVPRNVHIYCSGIRKPRWNMVQRIHGKWRQMLGGFLIYTETRGHKTRFETKMDKIIIIRVKWYEWRISHTQLWWWWQNVLACDRKLKYPYKRYEIVYIHIYHASNMMYCLDTDSSNIYVLTGHNCLLCVFLDEDESDIAWLNYKFNVPLV